MDVIINEVVSSVRMVDSKGILDDRTLATIVRTVLAAVEDRDRRTKLRGEETKIEDDGRGDLARTGGY